MVISFKYLGRVILAADDDWPEVVNKLARERKVWSRMSRILSREGVAMRVPSFFLKAMVQAVLLFGADTWVVISSMGKALGGFHTHVERRLTGWLLWRTLDGRWIYTSAASERAPGARVGMRWWEQAGIDLAGAREAAAATAEGDRGEE